MGSDERYSTTYVDSHYDESQKTLHLAHFLSKPQHFAAMAIGHRPLSDAKIDGSPFAESSPELTARIRDELEEMATNMCSALFQLYKLKGGLKETTKRVYDEVIQVVKSELAIGIGEKLEPGDASMVALKVADTAQLSIECLQLRHQLDMLTMRSITHTVINRSQEEKMDQGRGKQLIGWKPGWTWGHHKRLVEMKDFLQGSWYYSVGSPMDLMRMLGNADRHPNSLFKGITPLQALLDEFPPILCLTASLIPFENSSQLGVNDEQRALAKQHLKDNPEWRELFHPQ